jgi:hypothetical protein
MGVWCGLGVDVAGEGVAFGRVTIGAGFGRGLVAGG